MEAVPPSTAEKCIVHSFIFCDKVFFLYLKADNVVFFWRRWRFDGLQVAGRYSRGRGEVGHFLRHFSSLGNCCCFSSERCFKTYTFVSNSHLQCTRRLLVFEFFELHFFSALIKPLTSFQKQTNKQKKTASGCEHWNRVHAVSARCECTVWVCGALQH